MGLLLVVGFSAANLATARAVAPAAGRGSGHCSRDDGSDRERARPHGGQCAGCSIDSVLALARVGTGCRAARFQPVARWALITTEVATWCCLSVGTVFLITSTLRELPS